MEFLKKIYEVDEGVRRKWLLIITSAVMLGVVYVWLVYFGNIVAEFGQQPGVEESKPTGGFSFFETMKNGAAIVFESFGVFFDSPGEYFLKP